MNFVIAVAGGLIGNIIAPKVKEISNRVYNYFEYPKIEINTREKPIEAMSIFAFLVNKVRESKNYDNCGIGSINIYGKNELSVIPTFDFDYREYYYKSLVSFGVRIIRGETMHGFVYEIYGNYFSDRLEQIIDDYKSYFYNFDSPDLIVPAFTFDRYWEFNPKILYSNSEINYAKVDEIYDFISKKDTKAIMLSGPNGIGKTKTVFQIGYKMKKNIYFINNLIRPQICIDSIRQVAPNSIIIFKNIEEIFTKGLTKDNISIDTLIGVFDFISSNTIIFFCTSDYNKYLPYENLFTENRINQVYQF